jgi:valyl-tRNA synthetase
MCQAFPDGASFPNPAVDAEFTFLKNFVTGIRNLKAESKVPPGKKIRVWIRDTDEKTAKVLRQSTAVIMSLAKLEGLTLVGSAEDSVPEGPMTKVVVSAVEVARNIEILVPLTELKDLGEELRRVEKEILEVEKLFENQNKKLSNESFVGRAPPEVIEKERLKLAEYQDRMLKTQQLLKELKNAN